jgi:nucleoid DNA-binding protein
LELENMAKEAAKKSITKGQFVTDIAEECGLTKADVTKVLDAMESVIVKQLGPKGPGTLALPGLFKLKAKRIPAQKGGKVVPNRFKPGETTVTKDKPASTKVTARPLKKLKEALTPTKK